MDRVAEVRRRRLVLDVRADLAGVVDRVLAVRAPVTLVHPGLGVDDDDAEVRIPVGDVQLVRLRVHLHVSRLREQRRAVDAAVRVVAVAHRGLAPADLEEEVAVLR